MNLWDRIRAALSPPKPRHLAPRHYIPGDYLDGCCDLDFDMGPATPDDLVPWVVLFADLIDYDHEPLDERRVLIRAAEWKELFGGT